MLWVAWIRWEMINTRTTALPEERTEGAVIYRLLCHHFSHQSAYLGNRSAAEMSASIEAFAQKQKGQGAADGETTRSEEHTSELQSIMRISSAVFSLKKKI